jgi:hypothetical protein
VDHLHSRSHRLKVGKDPDAVPNAAPLVARESRREQAEKTHAKRPPDTDGSTTIAAPAQEGVIIREYVQTE